MRTIVKSTEPSSLATQRLGKGNYDGYSDKDALRRQLVHEQRRLCCYCLERIDDGTAKVEHWHPQADYPSEQLDYRNLLAACRKGEGWPGGGFCEAHKGNRVLSRNPANPSHRVEALLRYENDGSIRSIDTAFDGEINSVLNLNHAVLLNRRIGVLDGFKEGLRGRDLDTATLKRLIAKWNDGAPGSDLEPFCMIVVYWLRKRLARA